MANDYIDFDEGKPFFEYVGVYLAAVAGSPAVFNAGNPMGFTNEQFVSLQGIVAGDRHVYPLESYSLAQAGKLPQSRFVELSCRMLANTAYSAVEESNDHSPEFEFFRHVRNASSHGNHFNFSNREPSRPAAWRAVRIDDTLKGSANPLHGKPCFGGVIGPADILLLLHDIEAKL